MEVRARNETQSGIAGWEGGLRFSNDRLNGFGFFRKYVEAHCRAISRNPAVYDGSLYGFLEV